VNVRIDPPPELDLEPAPLAMVQVHCARCGRVLRNPRSKKAGIGPDCKRKWSNRGR
jgi:hypothetical protein